MKVNQSVWTTEENKVWMEAAAIVATIMSAPGVQCYLPGTL